MSQDPSTDFDHEDDIPSLRRAASKAKALEKERDALLRQQAFLRAGVNVDDPKMKYFVAGYDGEVTPEAIRKEATQAGFLGAEERQAQADATAQLAQTQAVEDRIARAGSPTAGALGGATHEQQLEEAFASGGTQAMLAKAAEFGIPISGQAE